MSRAPSKRRRRHDPTAGRRGAVALRFVLALLTLVAAVAVTTVASASPADPATTPSSSAGITSPVDPSGPTVTAAPASTAVSTDPPPAASTTVPAENPAATASGTPVPSTSTAFPATTAPAATTTPATASTGEAKAASVNAQALGAAFTCNVPTSFLSQGSPTTQLFASAYGSGSVTYSALGSPTTPAYNALGFNPTNNYLYGIGLGTNTLLQIDSTGGVTSLGGISGFPVVSNSPSNGAFDGTAPGANYWVTGGNGSTTLYEINVTSSPPTVIKTLTLSQSWQPIDFSASGGFMWGLSGTTVYRLNLTNGTVSTFSGPSGITSGNFGAAWTFSNGNLGFSNNGTGDIYQISVTNPSGTPTFGLVSHYTGPVAGTSNDGAACVAQPVDLGITKTAAALVAPAATITWTLTVTNHGPGNSSGYAVNDVIPAGVTNVTSPTGGCRITGNTVQCSEGALANGASFTITLLGTAPATNGTCFTNTATVTGNEVDSNTANNSSSVQTCTTAGISVVKSASITSFTAPGKVVTYSYLVTNNAVSTGQSLGAVKVTDPMSGLSTVICPSTTLDPGKSETCTATYATTQADVDRGSIDNTGTATGTPPAGAPVSASSALSIPATRTPGISVVKSASITGFSTPGVAVNYSYLVKNTGNVTLTSVGVTDPMTGLSAITCTTKTLAPQASETCTATYTTSQADVDRGSVNNTGTATGTPPAGANVTATSSVTIPGTRTPGISIVKSANITGFSAPGAAVTYSYLLKNTGNVTLTSVGVTDPLPGQSAVTCPNPSLAPGSSEICTATYTTILADVNRGSVTNTGSASGTSPTGVTVTAQSSVTIPASQSPAISLAKTASTSPFASAGTAVSYNYVITNTGNVSLHSIVVNDPMPGLSSVTCPDSTLDPGQKVTCTASYTTTQADVDRGSITNTATASGTPPTGAAKTAQASVTIPQSQSPSIGLEKSSNISSFTAAGTLVTYSYKVTNSGNVSLTAVRVTDPMSGLSAVTCPSSTLVAQGSETCTATYTTTQADVDRGSINNTGTATGTPPSGPALTRQSSVTIPATNNPGLTLAKSATITGFSAPGTLVTYSYKVTNSGNLTLHSVGVTDPMSGLTVVNCPTTTLAPGVSETCTATYTTTQADVDRGSINNTGTASGSPPTGSAVTARSSLNIPATRLPVIKLAKTPSPATFAGPGVLITYSYRVTNSGNVTLAAVNVSDPMSGLSAISCSSGTLAPAASEVCTATYTTTQADVDQGSIVNVGTANGTPPVGDPVTSQSQATVTATVTPAIGLVKTASLPNFSATGTGIIYSYKVTNTGNVTLTSVHVTDPMPGLPAVNCPSTSLSPNGTETCTATYTTTQADVDRGSVANTGTAAANPPSGVPVTHQSSVTVPAVQGPAIALVKSASLSSFAAAGTLVTYSYRVTNTGNVTLTPVIVTDPMPGLSALTCPGSSLAPAVSETCTATYTTTQADVDRTTLTNTGTAAGTPPSGPAVTASSTLILPAVLTPAIGIVKTASIASFSATGVAVTYTYVLTNTGNVTLQAVGVTDPLPRLSVISCPVTTLATGASETCTATYATTQADLDRGSVTNTGTAAGTTPSGLTVTATSVVTIPGVQTAKISLVKAADTPSFVSAGTLITYNYTVTNTGNVTLSPIAVTDPMAGLSAINCRGITSLAPGAAVTCVANYATTQADVDSGGVNNTGTATGKPPSGSAVTAQSSTTVPAIRAPAIGLVKSASITVFSGPRVAVTYSYQVSNVGNATLTGVNVTDPMSGLSPLTCPTATLAPAQSETCTATYTTTQADVDSNGITNTGTATGSPPSGPDVTNSSTLTIPASQIPAITLAKTATVPSFSAPSQQIGYEYEVSNAGNVTLTGLTVVDPMPGLSQITCPMATLAPGAKQICTATYNTTQADVDRGSISNTGTAHGIPPSGPAVSAISTATVPANLFPTIELGKTANPPSFTLPGTLITYSYLVINSGNVTLQTIGVTDPMTGLSSVICPNPTLAPGANEVCTATYTTTQADADRGAVVNSAVVTGTSPQGVAVTDRATATVSALQSPHITLVKSASATSFSSANAVITYRYLVKNTGNVTLTSLNVTDPMSGLSVMNCQGVTSLAPGASQTCTAVYSTTQADVNAGGITNTGNASGTPPTGPAVTQSSTLTLPAVQTPAIGLVKSASIVNFSAPGVLVTYSYLVTNTGNVSLASVNVADPMPGLSAVSCPSTALTFPSNSEICTATYTTTQADVDRGSVTNTGTAFGTPPTGPVVSHQSTVTLPAATSPAITFVKSANPTSFAVTGTTIAYSYLVTNTGNVTLTAVAVTDPLAGLSPVTCPSTSLAPLASETCTATYITTQADLDRGRIVNTASVTATPPGGPALALQSSTTVLGSQRPAILLHKTADVGTFSAPGVPVTYSYAVANTGNVTLTSLTVTDPMPALSAITCPVSTLAPNAQETCTANYTTTQADVDAGTIRNTGTATGTPPNGLPHPTSQASAAIPAFQTPAITMTKAASITGFSVPGTPVTYTYLVTNTGNVTVTSIAVADPLPGLAAVSCPNPALTPGQEETCTATYSTTQADVDRGQIVNSATASATPPTGAPITGQSTVTIPATQTPVITVTKSADIPTFFSAGTLVSYDYAVVNAGNVTLTGIAVTDPMVGLSSVTCAASVLAPGALETCTATYTTTQADVDRGTITNIGTARGTPPSGPAISATSTVTLSSAQTAAIGLTKSASITSFSAPGTAVTYTYRVTNSGNVTLHSVNVVDPMAGLSAVACPASPLAPGSFETCTATYTTTQADLDRGGITNTGTASGLPPSGPAVSDPSTVTVPANQGPAITLVKSASIASYSGPGVSVTYSYLVTNSGNVTLTSVNVIDPLPGLSTISCPITALAPTASETCSATYTTSQADVDRGHVTNSASAFGTPPTGPPPVSGGSTVTIQANQHPALTLVKSASLGAFSAAGTPVTYSYLIANTGNVTLHGVTIADPMPGLSGISCTRALLRPGTFESCTATYTTTQADVDRGSITNTGTASGTPPSGPPISQPSSVTIPGTQLPAIALVKSADISTFAAVGTPVNYSYLVTNTGNVTLTALAVADPMPGLSPVTCPGNSLSPGGSETCSATYTTAQADVDRGAIVNTATASGAPPSGAAVTANSTVTVPAVQAPGINLEKSANVNSFSAAGTVVTYSYTVTNTGNTTLNQVVVTDPMPRLSTIACPFTSLAPAGQEICTATYTTTQADVDAGSIINQGMVSGTPPTGPALTDHSTETIDAVQQPAVGLLKTPSISSFAIAGTAITYTYQVTNSGNVTLHAVAVTDPMAGLSSISCPFSTLTPGESNSCSATYTTTQADVNAGAIANTGTVTATAPLGQTAVDETIARVPAIQAPGVELRKTSDTPSFASSGTPIPYHYRVTNTGNVTLDPVTVTDPMPGLSPIDCGRVTALDPGEFVTCNAAYTTTQADVNAGSITNIGTVTATPPSGPAVTDESTVTVPAIQGPAIALAKSADVTGFDAPGILVTYSYRVRNVGNVDLRPVLVTDPMIGLSAIDCEGLTALSPGQEEVCSATYTTTQADLNMGGLTNTGTAVGTPPTGADVANTSELTIPADQAPAISVTKSANLSTFSAPGTPLTYTYAVVNSGNITLDPVTVSDPMPGLSALSCPFTSLAPGAGGSCTASYTTTQADVDRGSINNTGTAVGTTPSGPPATATSSVTVPASQTPAIALTKTASLPNFAVPGTTITYSYAVTNSGNLTLNPVKVTDPMADLSPISCPFTTLAPAGSGTCTATYTTKQADVDRGSITNTGTAAGTPPSGPAVGASATVTVPAITTPRITLVKSAGVMQFTSPGELIHYDFEVANPGNVTLNPVVLADPMPGLSAISCPAPSLGAGISETCTATYTSTQADVDRGAITNQATVTGTPPTGPAVSDTSTATVSALQTAVITLQKSADKTIFDAVGTTIAYSYTVRNGGNVTLNSVEVTDPMPGLSAIDCQGMTSLAPGASITCRAAYTTTAADVATGAITNTGTATGSAPDATVVRASSSFTIQKAAIALVKTADVKSFESPGTVITYSYAVTNTGRVALDPVAVSDPMPGLSPIDCKGSTSLAPDASVTCTATYTTTQADVNAGAVTNVATATGTPPDGADDVTASGTVTVPAPATPGLALIKSADVTAFSTVGTKVTYSFLVTNTGNVTIGGVRVVDPMAGLSAVTCPATSLTPTASMTCTATYTITAADLQRGSIVNAAFAAGSTVLGLVIATRASTVILPDSAAPPTASPVAPESPVTPETIPVTG